MSLMETKFPFASDWHGSKLLKTQKEAQIKDARDGHNSIIEKRKLDVV